MLVVHPPQGSYCWTGGRTYAHMIPELTLDEILSPAQASAWHVQITTARETDLFGLVGPVPSRPPPPPQTASQPSRRRQAPVPPGSAELSGGVNNLFNGYWWQVYPPLIVLVLVVVAFRQVGDALNDIVSGHQTDVARRRRRFRLIPLSAPPDLKGVPS